MDLAILPAMAYEFLDDAIMPDPPALLTSSFTVRLDSLVEGVNSVPVNWELPAGTWFIAAIPALALAATLRRKARRTIGR